MHFEKNILMLKKTRKCEADPTVFILQYGSAAPELSMHVHLICLQSFHSFSEALLGIYVLLLFGFSFSEPNRVKKMDKKTNSFFFQI